MMKTPKILYTDPDVRNISFFYETISNMVEIQMKQWRISLQKYQVAFLLLISILIVTSCNKLVEIPAPENSIAKDNVYTKDATAAAVLTGIFTDMTVPGGSVSAGFTGKFSISTLAGLSADELKVFDGVGNSNLIAYYKNELVAKSNPISGSEHWGTLYKYLYRCNAAIEGLNAADLLTPVIKKQLLGEAKFLRAFLYFYLVNLFGDVPLPVTTDYKVNTLLARSTKDQVYEQIITDLKDAQELLSLEYLDATLLNSTMDRVRPTMWAASALLARVYLYNGNYDKAEVQATIVINNAALFSLPSLNNVFKKNSQEAIWQLQPTTINFNTEDAITFIITDNGLNNINPYELSTQLLNSFEPGDHRSLDGNWLQSTTINGITYNYPFKYKINQFDDNATSPSNLSEYLMVLRLGEQFLIRAEARARQDNLAGSRSDLDAIRVRANLNATTANDRESLLAAILHERQVELFTEWGHRWFDIKRTGEADAVMNIVTPLKGGTWQPTDKLYPLPLDEIKRAPNLNQNDGYN